MKNVRMTICLVIAVLVMATSQGFGWTQYKDGLTHNISSTTNDDVWVDYLAPGMQTTVNLLTGGDITTPYTLRGYNDSRINISGGSVSGFYSGFYANDSSRVTISDGSIYFLYANNSSQVTISGGTVGGRLYANDSSRVTISNGTLNYLDASSNSQVTISGGSGNSYSTGGHLTMSGGSASYLYARGNGQVIMSGGTITNDIMADGQAILAISGSNFAIDGISVGFGEIKSIFGGGYSNDPFRRLTGTLANGDRINSPFQIGGNTASIVLVEAVPEPATLLLLGLGGVLLSKRGR